MIASSCFTDLDVSSADLTIAQAMYASLLCSNALDMAANKFGKPEIKVWLVGKDEVATNAVTKPLYETWLVLNSLEDTDFNREKYAVTECPFTLGYAGVFNFADNEAVFNYLVTNAKFDSLVLGSDLTIVSKLGTIKAATNLNQVHNDPTPQNREGA